MYVLSLMVVCSCNKDDGNNLENMGDNNPVSNQYINRGLSFKVSGYSDFQNDNQFNSVINQLSLTERFIGNNISNRTDGNDVYGFTIDTTEIRQIEYENYTSYTFKINRGEESEGILENLVIETSQGGEEAYITSYIPDQQWLDDVSNGIETEFNGTVRIENLNNNNSNRNTNIANRSSCGSYYVIVETQCPCAGHWPGQSCDCGTPPSTMWYEIEQSCDDTSGYYEGPVGPRGGGGGSGNPSSGDSASAPVGISNSDGSSSSLQNVLDGLNSVLNESDTFNIDFDLQSNQIANFSSANDFGNYINNLNLESSAINLVDENQNQKTYNFDFELDSFLNLNLRANVQIELPEPNSDECLEVIGVSSLIFGNTSIFSWDQIGEPDIQIQEDNDIVRIEFQGTLTTGIKIEGWPFKVTRIYSIRLDFNYSTSEPISGNILSID